MIIRDHLLKQKGQPADILGIDNVPEVLQTGADLPCVDIELRYEALDLGVSGRDEAFVVEIQLFEELLSRARTGESNLDIPIRLEPGEQNEVARQIDDLDRF